jgi:hypothetical protein
VALVLSKDSKAPTPSESEGINVSEQQIINKGRKRGRENPTALKVWTYGIGLEGMKGVVGENSFSAVVIDENFPWWALAVVSAGIKVSRVWLTGCASVDVALLGQNWNPDVCVDIGPTPTKEFLQHLDNCEALFVGGRVPRILETKGFWSNSQLKLVVSTRRSDKSPPAPWVVDPTHVTHHRVGGVTNGRFLIVIHKRGRTFLKPLRTHMSVQPSQDLRWSLKSGEPGRLVSSAMPPQDLNVISKVVYRGKNVVSASGLYPIGKTQVMVETEFRGTNIVRRQCTPFEMLLILDAPEKLIRLAETDSIREELIGTIAVPGKVFQHVVDWVQSHKLSRDAFLLDSPVQASYPEIERLLEARSERALTSKRRRLSFREQRWAPHMEAESILLPVVQRFRMEGYTPLTMIPEESELLQEPEGSSEEKFAFTDPNVKATKDDDAKVRCELWDKHLLKGFSRPLDLELLEISLPLLRDGFLCVWKRNIQRSYFVWEKTVVKQGGKITPAIRDAARDCIQRSSNSSWWNWEQGSRPLFWRWTTEYQTVIREGIPPKFTGIMTPWTEPQRGPKNSAIGELVIKKLLIIDKKAYIEEGKISSLMPFFNVPKGEDDVRMVYDGSASGLNANLWAPWFTLPTVDCLLRALEPGYSMADNDVGEMFHNFMLHEDMRHHCGLDISLYPLSDSPSAEGECWRRWTRLAMGLRTSPYNAVQGMLMAQEFILGSPRDESNIFHWVRLRLNLPGMSDYDPGKSWVAKIRSDGQVAADIFIYVDDVRSSAWDDESAWLASQRTSSRLAFLGLQDAARKRRDPGQETGAWTGSVVWTSENQLVVMTTQDKWDKAREQLAWVQSNIRNPKGMDGKTLKSIRGFLVYVSRTYPSMIPYLKGIHATIDSWRSGRDADGWKLKKRKESGGDPASSPEEFDELDVVDIDPALGLVGDCVGEPTLVFPVARLHGDLSCLLELTASDTPPKRVVRMTSQARVIYGFGDASKQGFGASIELPDKAIFWRFGQWRLREEQVILAGGKGMSFVEERSSNYRELRNLVETLEEAFRKGLLCNREIFMFTDNSTAESAFFRGTSSSRHLFNLVLRLRKIEMDGSCKLHMIHVAGTRMIWQGTDGLSRGDKSSGVMAGETMLSFIPLHLSVSDRSPACVDWISSWYSDQSLVGPRFPLKVLSPDDWASVLCDSATYVWLPPPAAADVAAHYLALAIHKRPTSTHLFLCPRLMTSRWLRLLRKATDMILTISPTVAFWDMHQHEPLILAVSLPLSRCNPWKHGGSPHCEHTRKVLQTMLQSDPTRSGLVLRECIDRAWVLAEL